MPLCVDPMIPEVPPFVAHTDDASMSSLSMSILSQRDVATDLRGLR